VAAAASTSSTGVTGACGANVYQDAQGIDSSPGEKKGFLDS